MKTHIATGLALVLGLTAGTVHAGEQLPRVFVSSNNVTMGVHFEELVEAPIQTDKSGYMLLALSPHEQAVFSNGKLVRYLCIDGDGRQCRAQISPPASLIAGFSALDGERWQGMKIRIMDEDFFEGHPRLARHFSGYELTGVDWKPYKVSYDPETSKVLISRGK